MYIPGVLLGVQEIYIYIYIYTLLHIRFRLRVWGLRRVVPPYPPIQPALKEPYVERAGKSRGHGWDVH